MDRNATIQLCRNVGIVALRKESVDRNIVDGLVVFACAVALRKESVDRNTLHPDNRRGLLRRSPQGERG